MKKRILSILLCAAMSATLMVGCGGKKEEAPAPSEPAKQEETATEPEESSEGITMAVAATVTTLNPLLETMAEGSVELAPYADELYFAGNGETRYYLADKCEVAEDGVTYTLTLKDGLKWHDGEAITADDVVFTMDCVSNTDNGTGFTNVAFMGEEAVKYEKVDDLTVKFTTPKVSASYFELLGRLLLIPAHAFDGNTDIVSADANLTDIGSGPYKVSAFNNGESILYEAFEDYYQGTPAVPAVAFKVIGDPSAQEVAFQNGEINFLVASSDAAAVNYQNMDGVTLYQIPEGRVKYLAWNKYCSTWENRDAVKAVFYALNQDEIIQGAYGEVMGTPANTVFSKQNMFYDASMEGYKQNLDEAKKLAEASGLAGKTITLYYNTDRTYMEQTALVIQQQLKAIDVTVDVQGIDANGFFGVVFTDQDDYELYLNEYGTSGDPDSVIAGMFDGTWGINVDTSQEILDMFVKARETVDQDERAAIYKELQAKAKEQFLTYPIAYPNYCFAVPSNLAGADAVTTTPVFEDYSKLAFK